MSEAEIDPARALANAAAALRQHSIPFALIGGLAVSARAEPRFTKDVDLAIVVTDDRQFEQLVYQLGALGFVLRQQLDQLDLQNLLAVNPNLDLERVRELLRLITERGYARDQDLFAKLEALLHVVGLSP